jgi:hypothetical protein
MAQKHTDKQYLQHWKEFADGIRNSTPVDTTEKISDRIKRVKALEEDREAWFKYYFPKYAAAPPAAFHKAATSRVLDHPEWSEVRNWARELAKSTRTMMEVLYLVLTGKKSNVLIVSNSLDNAMRLLLPYKVNLEANNRIIQDYGEQENLGTWEAAEFTTKKGAAFRAIGAGQSPRGTRNEAKRPDVILIDDIDTDEDCRNPDIIDARWNWIQEALIPTRSVSNPLLIIWCGNIIAEDCCVVRAAERADHVDRVNIRDEHGKSTWPAKNSEEDIDRVLSQISYASAQKEYFNNPMATGKTFPELTWGKCPPLHELQFVVVYADPATSNKDKPGQKSNLTNSRKAVFVVGRKKDTYYIYNGFLDVMSNAIFIQSMYACRDYIGNACPTYFYVENNTLQDPFYEQVLLPLVFQYGHEKGGVLGITPDTTKKPEKWARIEANLEPINRLGLLIFNEEQKTNPHMQRLEAQFKAAKPTSKQLDGPDCIEGAVQIIKQKLVTNDIGSVGFVPRSRSSKYF